MLTFADFEPGRQIVHRMSRTLFASESAYFSALFHHHNPVYLDAARAQEAGFAGIIINPYYLFNLVLGLSVPDLTEHGGPFLGADDIEFARPVYDGESVSARTVVRARRVSASRSGWGIVTWYTEGLAGAGDVVLSYTRSNLIPMGAIDE